MDNLSYYLKIVLDMVLIYDDMKEVNFDDFFDMCYIPIENRSDFVIGCMLRQAFC